MKVTSVRDFLDVCKMGNRTPIPYRVEAPLDVWQQVITEHACLRETVATNKTIPEEIIRQLASDEDADVRFAIAQKRKTPPDVLLALTGDPCESVRQRVACNPKATREVLAALVDDEWEPVREHARKRLAELDGPGDDT